MLDLWQKVEAAILRRRLAEPVATEANELPVDPIVEELAELRARLRRIEELLTHLGGEESTCLVQRAPPQPVRLAKGEEIGADRHLSPLNGFYPMEVDPGLGMFRWTGPTHEFLFHLDINRSHVSQFELHLMGGMRPTQCEGIALLIDGQAAPIGIKADGKGFAISFSLPPRTARDISSLLFVVPRMYRPSDLDGGDDIRPLGVRFRALKRLA